MPVANPEQLVIVARNPQKPSTGFNYPDYEYVRDHNKSFTGVVAYSSGGGNPVAFVAKNEGVQASTELATTALVSGNYFEMLG